MTRWRASKKKYVDVGGLFVGSPDDEVVNAEAQWRRNLTLRFMFCFCPKNF